MTRDLRCTLNNMCDFFSENRVLYLEIERDKGMRKFCFLKEL